MPNVPPTKVYLAEGKRAKVFVECTSGSVKATLKRSGTTVAGPKSISAGASWSFETQEGPHSSWRLIISGARGSFEPPRPITGGLSLDTGLAVMAEDGIWNYAPEGQSEEGDETATEDGEMA